MNNNMHFLSTSVDKYNQHGFAVLEVFDDYQFLILEKFTKDWLYRLLGLENDIQKNEYPLETYHIWSKSMEIDHSSICSAGNRYAYPGEEIEKIIMNNNKINSFLRKIGVENYEIWDDGWGWLGFRLIRPGVEDGYPLSRKAWGKAENVVSCWAPVIGYEPSETLTLVPGSHMKEYNKYMPEANKFCKGEYRLSEDISKMTFYNPKLSKGEIIFYHPKTLHTENVISSNITRLNLEFRLDPILK